jgi:hypothetical protein
MLCHLGFERVQVCGIFEFRFEETLDISPVWVIRIQRPGIEEGIIFFVEISQSGSIEEMGEGGIITLPLW